MSRIIWDQVGKRGFEAGVDRAVFYSSKQLVVVDEMHSYPKGFPWNGLATVDVTSQDPSTSSLYLDGKKTIDLFMPGDFSAKIKAFTYPDEFIEFDGYFECAPGFFIDNQFHDKFGLCYRTLLGNDVDGANVGYKLHIVYNAIAVPESLSNQTIDSNIQPISFGWTITSIPEEVSGYRPSAHIIIDSTKMPVEVLSDIEDLLYGTDLNTARLPTMSEILAFMALIITDNNDGAWSAIGPDSLITMIDENTFQIVWDRAIYLNADTYEIS